MHCTSLEFSPFARVVEHTSRPLTVQVRPTNIYLPLTMARLTATINGTEYEKGAGFPVATS